MNTLKGLLLAGAIALTFASCKSDSTSANNGTNNAPANTMVITVSGKTYTMLASATKTNQSGQTIIAVAGGDTSGVGCGLTLSNIPGPGTYDIGTVSFNGTTVETVVLEYNTGGSNSQTYASPQTGTTKVGTVTIQQLDATTVKATFNGTLTLNGSGAGTPVTVSNGSVNATIH